jgi:hypothetical protein
MQECLKKARFVNLFYIRFKSFTNLWTLKWENKRRQIYIDKFNNTMIIFHKIDSY